MTLHSVVLVEEGTCLLQLELMALLGCLISGTIMDTFFTVVINVELTAVHVYTCKSCLYVESFCQGYNHVEQVLVQIMVSLAQ